MINIERVAVIGLGKLGTPLLAVLASARLQVIGVDVDAERVAALNQGRTTLREPMLNAELQASRDCYRATTDLREAVQDSDAIFLILPTPSRSDGSFSLGGLLAVCTQIGEVLRDGRWRLIVVVSTVMPGHTAELCAELEQASGKEHGAGFGLVYSPEFIALGDVLRGLHWPDYVLIGAEDEQVGALYDNLWRRVAPQATRARMNWINAELTKLANNVMVTLKMSFANELARLCHALPGAHVDRVTEAIGLDHRIGFAYLRGGMPFGGPCFPRDGRALTRAGEKAGQLIWLPEAASDSNGDHLFALAQWIWTESGRLGSRAVVGLLGLTYKTGTPVIEESMAVELLLTLNGSGAMPIPLVVYDEYEEAVQQVCAMLKQEQDMVAGATCVHDCVQRSDLLVLTLRSESLLAALSAVDLSEKVLLDVWGYARHLAPRCRRYVAWGRS